MIPISLIVGKIEGAGLHWIKVAPNNRGTDLHPNWPRKAKQRGSESYGARLYTSRKWCAMMITRDWWPFPLVAIGLLHLVVRSYRFWPTTIMKTLSGKVGTRSPEGTNLAVNKASISASYAVFLSSGV